MIYESAVMSHVGCQRKNNQDNYYLNGVYRQDIHKDIFEFSEPQARHCMMAGVFDGAGGASYGEIASFLAVQALASYEGKYNLKELIQSYIPETNQRIVKESETRATSMGTTMAVLCLEDNIAKVCNLGDSRIYLLRDKRLMQITYDHTQAQLMQEKMADSPVGLYTEEFQYIKEKHILLKYLGMKNQTAPSPYYMQRIPVVTGDIFLLCSDGLFNMLSQQELYQYMEKTREQTPIEMARFLTGEALLAGGKDNVTCMIIKTVEV